MLHLKLQTWNCFGIWHFLHPHKHIKGIKCRALKFGYSNAVLVVALDTKIHSNTSKNEKQLSPPHPPSFPFCSFGVLLRTGQRKEEEKPRTCYQLVCQPPVFHRFSLQLMASLRKPQFNLITITWQRSLSAPKARAPSLCYLRKLSCSLWDKPWFGPQS